MSNTLLNMSTITFEALAVLETEVAFAGSVYRGYDNKFAQEGAKVGDTANVRLPSQFTVTSGAAIDIQNVTDESVAVVLDTQNHVAFQFSSKELTLNIEDFSDRYIRPAVAPLGATIDADGMARYVDIYNSVGTPGTTPSALLTFLNAKAKLNQSGAPQDGNRCVVINSSTEAATVNALKGLFQSSSEIAKQYEKGIMGKTAGFTWKCDDHFATHTVGTYGGTPLCNGAGVDGAATLTTDGWSSGATSLKAGDVFTIANVNMVHPQTKNSLGVAQQFRVTADISDTTGDIVIAISPSLYLTGAKQNIDALPADDAAITVVGASATESPQDLAFHKNAFCLAMADLVVPGGVDMAYKATNKNGGFSIRVVRQYDINTDKYPCRLDVLYGWKTLRPELAVRVQG